MESGTYALTPLYDVLCAYPIIGRGKGKLPRQKAHPACPCAATRHIRGVTTPRHGNGWVRRAEAVPGRRAAMIWLATFAPDAIEVASAGLPVNFPEHARSRSGQA